MQWYSAEARDSRRLSDLANLKKSLELFATNVWSYPLPDNWLNVTYTWYVLRTQWTIWDNVTTNLSRNLNKKPLDPLFDIEYIYSVTQTKYEYEIMSIFESDISKYDLLNKSYASNNWFLTKIIWTYNWIYLKTPEYYFPTPSIITSESLPLDLRTSSWTSIKSQIVTWWDNIPNLWITQLVTQTWQLDINFNIYWAGLTKYSTNAKKIYLAEIMQDTYSWSFLSNQVPYKDILSETTDLDKINLVRREVLDLYPDLTSLPVDNSGPKTSCLDLKNSWINKSGTYDITVNEKTIKAYCDMTTDWWGWTLVMRWKWWDLPTSIWWTNSEYRPEKWNSIDETFKFSSDDINALVTEAYRFTSEVQIDEDGKYEFYVKPTCDLDFWRTVSWDCEIARWDVWFTTFLWWSWHDRSFYQWIAIRWWGDYILWTDFWSGRWRWLINRKAGYSFQRCGGRSVGCDFYMMVR